MDLKRLLLGMTALWGVVTALGVAVAAAGLFGGLGMALAPRQTFRLVSCVVCPEGTRLEYYQVKRSFHKPGESEPHVVCVGGDGTRTDATLKAIGAVLGGVFVIVFGGVVTVGTLVLLLVRRALR